MRQIADMMLKMFGGLGLTSICPYVLHSDRVGDADIRI